MIGRIWGEKDQINHTENGSGMEIAYSRSEKNGIEKRAD